MAQKQSSPQQTFKAHATLRNGLARLVQVTAQDEIEARRRMFALYRPASLTAPKVVA
jgi:hypothetical protein